MAVAYTLGKRVLGDLAGQDGTVILLFPPRSLMNETMEQSYEDGFVLPMRRRHSTLHFKVLKFDGKPGNGGYDAAAFQKVLDQAPDALGVVSFGGVPVDSGNFFSAGKSLQFYAFDSGSTTNWLGPMKDGHIRAVVLPLPGADLRARAEVRGVPEDIFQQFYLLATPETADQVADQISKK